MSDNKYAQRGVSAQKEDVHKAVAQLDKGLFPNAFCKVYPDVWGQDPEYCNIMHADGAGTKSVIAYMYWKETGDISVWRDIAIDAIVMNIDDMLCVGAVGPYAYSSTIGRNKTLIPGEVISEIINGTQAYFDLIKSYGIEVSFMGGETADVGDVVRTIIVDGTMSCRLPRKKIIDPSRVKAGDVIVSFASFGQAAYESKYNSGIGSNGLTSARHDMLSKKYKTLFPESVDPNVSDEVIYNGKFNLTDTIEGQPLNIGQMILSPTRTYAPLVLRILKEVGSEVRAIIHNSGGGQTKCMHYLPSNLKVVKNNLIEAPILFRLIQEAAQTDWKEMYQVFNMGQRLEIYTDEKSAQKMIEIAHELNIDAQISGYVQEGPKELIIESEFGRFEYK